MAAPEVSAGGSVGDGRYRLQRRLGAGGMASVWLADDERLARRVAVKVISNTLAADERYRERFAREARAAASVSHPNIVPVYDYGVQDERPFLVLEYLPGGSLADLLQGATPTTMDVVAFAGQLLSALDCVHQAGLVHRDVKPANVMLDASGRARLTDFGIAQPEDAESLTQTGMIVGTLRYLAPEVLAGNPAGPAADLYACGMVLRELTAHQPTPELTGLIGALTAADPGDRPASAQAALQRVPTNAMPSPSPTAATRIVPAVPERPPAPEHGTDQTRRMTASAVPRTRSVSTRAALTAAAAVALVLVLVIAFSSGGDSSPPATNATSAVPAPAAAPLDDQLRALGQLVDQAAAGP